MSIHWKTAATFGFACLCLGFVLGVTGKSLLYLIAGGAVIGGGGWLWQKVKTRKP